MDRSNIGDDIAFIQWAKQIAADVTDMEAYLKGQGRLQVGVTIMLLICHVVARGPYNMPELVPSTGLCLKVTSSYQHITHLIFVPGLRRIY